MTDIKPITSAAAPGHVLVQQSLVIKGLKLDANIGVYDHEKTKTQPIRLWLKLHLASPQEAVSDAYDEVVCYDTIVQNITQIVSAGHINLVETLTQNIAAKLFENSAIQKIKIKIEKPAALANAEGVGIECIYLRATLSV